MGNPIPNVQYRLATDSSAYSIGCVLFQEYDDGTSKKLNFIGFHARSLTISEQRWSTTMRELLAVIFGATKF